MSITAFSVVMALLCFDLMVLFLSYMRRKTSMLIYWSLGLLLIILLLTFARIFLPVDFRFTYVVRSSRILPAVIAFLEQELILCGVCISIGDLLLLLWALVAAALLLRTAAQVITSERELHRACSVPLPDTHKTVLPASITDKVAVLAEPIIPCTCGFIHPRILLPQNMLDLPHKELAFVLRHEWQHYINGDLWIKLFMRVFTCIFWWNPINRLLLEDVDQILEMRCDTQVTRQMDALERIDYLKTLLSVAKQHTIPKPQALTTNLFTVRKESSLSQRVNVLLGSNHRITWKQCVALVFWVVFVFFGSYCFVVQPYTPSPFATSKLDISVETSYILFDGTCYTFYNSDGSFYEISKDTAVIMQKTILFQSSNNNHCGGAI